jgi:protein-L-isoaspartate(D-aspartate) O-methyltransferase
VASAATLRRRLVRQLQEKGLLRDPRLRAAFLDVPREQFVPDYAAEHGLEAVYRDQAIVTKQTEAGHGLSSSSQPGITAEMLDALGVEPGQRVLEIGAGTGYNAAILAQLVGRRGRVVSVDIDPGVARGARRALRGSGVKVVVGDGRDGHAALAPYDRIIATASSDEVPRAWLEQLAPSGLLQVPLRLRTSSGLQLIPTLQHAGDSLRSVSMICGGFMPIRATPDDLSKHWPVLNVVRSDGAESTSLVSIAADVLRQMPPRAARRLAATACSEPRSRPLGMRANAKSLAIYLSLRGPARRVVAVFDGRDYYGGLVSADGRSLALFPGWPTTSRMVVHGTAEAADELASLIREWDRAGRPSASAVSVSVQFRNGSSSIRTRWRGR